MASQDAYKKWFDEILKLPQYYEKFIEEGYDDISYLYEFDINNGEQELQEIGIKKKPHRRRILKEIEKLINAKKSKAPHQSHHPSNPTDLPETPPSKPIAFNPTDTTPPPDESHPYVVYTPRFFVCRQ